MNVPSQTMPLITFITSNEGGGCVPPPSSPLLPASAAAWIDSRQLLYQPSLSRVLSSTGASGQVSTSSSQNVQPGQSTVDSQPSNAASQSTGSPLYAASQCASGVGSRIRSIMWKHGP